MPPQISVTGAQNEKNRYDALTPLKPLPRTDPSPYAWNIDSLPYSVFILDSSSATLSNASFHDISVKFPDPLGPICLRGVLILAGSVKLLRSDLPFTHGVKGRFRVESLFFLLVSILMSWLSFMCATSSHREPQLYVQVNGICLISVGVLTIRH